MTWSIPTVWGPGFHCACAHDPREHEYADGTGGVSRLGPCTVVTPTRVDVTAYDESFPPSFVVGVSTPCPCLGGVAWEAPVTLSYNLTGRAPVAPPNLRPIPHGTTWPKPLLPGT